MKSKEFVGHIQVLLINVWLYIQISLFNTSFIVMKPHQDKALQAHPWNVKPKYMVTHAKTMYQEFKVNPSAESNPRFFFLYISMDV